MTPTPNRLLLISPDGRRGANVAPAHLALPLYAGRTDCTDLDDEALQLAVAARQVAA